MDVFVIGEVLGPPEAAAACSDWVHVGTGRTPNTPHSPSPPRPTLTTITNARIFVLPCLYVHTRGHQLCTRSPKRFLHSGWR